MSDKKNWASTVAGWFVERDEPAVPDITLESGQTPQSPAIDTFSATDSYTAASPTQAVFQKAPPRPAGGQVDFAAVFEAAGVDAEEQQRVARTTELIAQPACRHRRCVKKQIVEASLKAFGVPIEKIIEATVEEIQALDGYIRNGAADNEKLIQESDARIKQYEEEIKNIRAVMQQSVDEQQNADQSLQRQEARGATSIGIFRSGHSCESRQSFAETPRSFRPGCGKSD
jgi:hypothetical protein